MKTNKAEKDRGHFSKVWRRSAVTGLTGQVLF